MAATNLSKDLSITIDKIISIYGKMRGFEIKGDETVFRQTLSDLGDNLNRFTAQFAVVAISYPPLLVSAQAFSRQVYDIQSWVGAALIGYLDAKSVPFYSSMINEPLSRFVGVLEAIKKLIN